MRDHAMIQPGPATETFVLFDTGGAQPVRVSLARIVSSLERTPPTARGSSSTIWRFNLSRRGHETGTAPSGYALKRCHADPVTGVRSPPHEYGYLRRLSSPLFPKAIGHGVMENGDYLLVSEWIDGRNLARHSLAILTEFVENGGYEAFCQDLLEIRRLLVSAGIMHSDIWEPNIIVRNGHPVLIDFGWAHEPGEPPLSRDLHQPNDYLAINQMFKRLAALYDQLLLESHVAAHASGART